MTPDDTTRWITFRHPFLLAGLDLAHAPGQFELRTRHERLDASFPAYRLTHTIMLTNRSGVEALEVRLEDLDEALRRDAADPLP